MAQNRTDTVASSSRPVLAALVFLMASFAPAAVYAEDRGVCSTDAVTCLEQGWTEQERSWWYSTSQGSRLLPLSWALALERHDSSTGFFSEDSLSAYGYLPSPPGERNPHGLPVGFAVDTDESSKADLMCERFPETCNAFVMRKPWVGMTCAACHTNDIAFEGKTIRVEGAPTLAEFQGFLEGLLDALKATHDNDAKFDRFARAVLKADLSVDGRQSLRLQLAEQIAWQTLLQQRNGPDFRSGFGRLDAQGHILNKVAIIGGGPGLENALKSDAPSSYPFIWNTSQQDKVQWNGIARNILNLSILGKQTDIGALVRNTSEVIGVFAHVEISPKWKSGLLGYQSSLRAAEMIDLERQLARLKSPRWPEDILPEIDWAKAERGQVHFEAACAQCHERLAWDDVKTPIKVKMSSLLDSGTDMSLACNTFMHQANAGNYEGRRPFMVQGERIDSTDFTRNMLTNAAVGAVIGKVDELAGKFFDDVFDQALFWRRTTDETADGKTYLPGVKDPLKRELAAACLTSPEASRNPDESVLAYKARPLNGIWATAPYLHNGSVPTLYDLLLPSPLRLVLDSEEEMGAPGAGDRPSVFHVGSREFDPAKVGFKTGPEPIYQATDGRTIEPFEYRVYDANGAPIPGNYNSGHEYGTDNLSEEERWELVEYLKTL